MHESTAKAGFHKQAIRHAPSDRGEQEIIGLQRGASEHAVVTTAAAAADDAAAAAATAVNATAANAATGATVVAAAASVAAVTQNLAEGAGARIHSEA